jgi:hypothetical protein
MYVMIYVYEDGKEEERTRKKKEERRRRNKSLTDLINQYLIITYFGRGGRRVAMQSPCQRKTLAKSTVYERKNNA